MPRFEPAPIGATLGSMLLVLVAAAPSLALLIYFYLRDRYDREPISCLLVAYLLGMYAMLAAQSMGAVLAGAVSEEWLHLGGEPARLFEAFVLSGLVEEVAKWAMLMAAVYYWREFDEPLDGLIYGVTIALGFATLENFFYLSSHGVGIAWQRAIFAVPAHALFGGAMGYYAGRIKFAAKAGRRAASVWRDQVLCLGLPVLFHGAYNFALLHGLNWFIWVAITALSLGFWVFVLRRVRRAQKASPFRPKTMLPFRMQPPAGRV
jgi:RsiW-degrading membrane proteinase PrsW (M82 family)